MPMTYRFELSASRLTAADVPRLVGLLEELTPHSERGTAKDGATTLNWQTSDLTLDLALTPQAAHLTFVDDGRYFQADALKMLIAPMLLLLLREGYDTLVDPQLGRPVTFPADGPDIGREMGERFRAETQRRPGRPGRLGKLLGRSEPKPLVETFWTLLLIRDPATDPLAEARRIADGAPAPQGAGPAEVEALVSTMLEEDEALEVFWSDDRRHAGVLDYEGFTYDVQPHRVWLRTRGRSDRPPTDGGEMLEAYAETIIAAGWRTIYDPQLDRIVELPADAPAIAEAWTADWERALAALTPAPVG